MGKALADKFRQFSKGCVVFSCKSGAENAELRGFNKAINLLERMPDDEAEGHWVPQTNDREIPFDYIYVCSLCGGTVHSVQYSFNFKYCPYCGKRLQGVVPCESAITTLAASKEP